MSMMQSIRTTLAPVTGSWSHCVSLPGSLRTSYRGSLAPVGLNKEQFDIEAGKNKVGGLP